MNDLISAQHITVQYKGSRLPAVQDISLSLKPGRVLGIVGESGCGKSTLVKALMGILPASAKVGGEVFFRGEALRGISEDRRRSLLGNEMGVIVQDSISSLNPIRRIRSQFIELYREKSGTGRSEACEHAAQLLEQMHCPRSVLDRFPFQISGGQRQRVMIAMAFALKPQLLIADEPTTALDVTIQAEILREIMEMKRQSQTGILFISHNLGVIAQVADDIAVMLNGRIVEYGSREDILTRSEHPYTQELIRCVPVIGVHRSERLYTIGPNAGAENPSLGGCPFAGRCSRCMSICRKELPVCHKKREDYGYTRCHLLNTAMSRSAFAH